VDERKDISKHITWEIKRGDLVKVKHFDKTGDTFYRCGLVLEREITNQRDLFPQARILVFATGQEILVYPAYVDLISAS